MSFVAMAAMVCLGGCASAPNRPPRCQQERKKASSFTDKALEFFGIKKPEAPQATDKPDLAMPDRRINWKLAASDALNLNAQGQPVALLTRIYKLKC